MTQDQRLTIVRWTCSTCETLWESPAQPERTDRCHVCLDPGPAFWEAYRRFQDVYGAAKRLAQASFSSRPSSRTFEEQELVEALERAGGGTI